MTITRLLADRSTPAILGIAQSQFLGGKKNPNNDQPVPKRLGPSRFGMTWKMRGKKRLEIDYLTTGNIFICLLVNRSHPSAQPVPLSLKSILKLPYKMTKSKYTKSKCTNLVTSVHARNVTGAANKVVSLGSVCFSLSLGSRCSVLVSLSVIVAEDCSYLYLSFPDLSIASCWMDTHNH